MSTGNHIFRMLAVLLLLALGGCGTTPGAPRMPWDRGEPMLIMRPQVLVNPNGPGTASLVINGMQTECEQISSIRQSRLGATIHVDVLIERNITPQCATSARATPIQKIIPLDGAFEPGTYQVVVNDLPVSFDIPAE